MKLKMELRTSVAAVIFLLQFMLGVSSTPAQTPLHRQRRQ